MTLFVVVVVVVDIRSLNYILLVKKKNIDGTGSFCDCVSDCNR